MRNVFSKVLNLADVGAHNVNAEGSI